MATILPESQYRRMRFISNSDLSEFRDHLFGYPKTKAKKAFAFGSLLHQMALEPYKDVPVSTSADDLSKAYQILKGLRTDRFAAWVLQWSKKEQAIFWQDPVTQLPLKSKLDLQIRRRWVIDLKTTSVKSEKDFIDSCHQYEYDRQAAFYLDAVQGRKFSLIGIQKQEPFQIYNYTPESGFLEAGRKRYRKLLDEWYRLGGLEYWTPSSWESG